jgi:hypothetical protein
MNYGWSTLYDCSISVYGLSLQHDRDRIREFVGVQLQESALPPCLKVGEALKLFASFYPSLCHHPPCARRFAGPESRAEIRSSLSDNDRLPVAAFVHGVENETLLGSTQVLDR